MRNAKIFYGFCGALALAVLLALACSTDSPTAPQQNPPPPGGSGGAGVAYRITVTSDPDRLIVSQVDPATIIVDVRRADNNQRPPNGTTALLSTNLGSFDAADPEAKTVAIVLTGGVGGAFLFAGDQVGIARVVAQLEESFGTRNVPIDAVIEPIVASFDHENSDGDLTVQFLDTSTGGPTSWLWRFGDGGTSTKQHPMHTFPEFGDYAVELTASNAVSSDTFATIVTVEEPEEEEPPL